MIAAIFDSPLIGILSPVLTLAAMAALRYVQKEITGAINGTKDSVLTEVAKVDRKVGAVDAKVDGVITEQALVRDELRRQQEDSHSVKERIARLEGRRDAQLEAAQLANAVGNVAQAITHPREDHQP